MCVLMIIYSRPTHILIARRSRSVIREVLAWWRAESNVDGDAVRQRIADDALVMHVETFADCVDPRRVRAGAGLDLDVKPDDGSLFVGRPAHMVDGVPKALTRDEVAGVSVERGATDVGHLVDDLGADGGWYERHALVIGKNGVAQAPERPYR